MSAPPPPPHLAHSWTLCISHQIRNVTAKLPEQMWWKSLDQKSDYVRVDVRIFAREQFVNVHIVSRTPPQAYWTSYDIVIMLRANILLGTPDILYCHVLPNKLHHWNEYSLRKLLQFTIAEQIAQLKTNWIDALRYIQILGILRFQWFQSSFEGVRGVAK